MGPDPLPWDGSEVERRLRSGRVDNWEDWYDLGTIALAGSADQTWGRYTLAARSLVTALRLERGLPAAHYHLGFAVQKLRENAGGDSSKPVNPLPPASDPASARRGRKLRRRTELRCCAQQQPARHATRNPGMLAGPLSVLSDALLRKICAHVLTDAVLFPRVRAVSMRNRGHYTCVVPLSRGLAVESVEQLLSVDPRQDGDLF
jgi:hypothetical protein